MDPCSILGKDHATNIPQITHAEASSLQQSAVCVPRWCTIPMLTATYEQTLPCVSAEQNRLYSKAVYSSYATQRILLAGLVLG